MFTAAAIMALIAIASIIVMLASCTPVQRSTMTGAFTTCAQGDLGALVSPGVSVMDDISGLIKGNSPTLEADLTGLAVTFGIAVIECAIAAVESVLMAPSSPATGSGAGGGSDSGSGSAAPLVATAKEPPQGLVRARTWLTQQKLTLAKKPGAAK